MAATVLALGARSTPAADLPLVFEERFDRGADRWQPTDAAAWRVIDTEGGKAYSLFQQSKYQPPHRSPVNFSLVKDLVLTDFLFEARLQSTSRQYDHRDMCLVFGYRDTAHFYYVHLGKKTDDHANQIFIVDGKPRTKISTKTSPGTNWDDAWHTVRVTRKAAGGEIEVYFDDMKTPVMTAVDRTFSSGQIGVGSFDDTGNFTGITVRGVKSEPVKQ
jgi:hypothetical protein